MVGRNIYFGLAAALAGVANAVNPLKVEGSNFVDTKTGDRFEIIGVDYQPGGSASYKPQDKVDPLSNSKQCLRDAILMQGLGINTIRVYNLDPLISHDDCATIFNAAGIYMIIDVNSPLPNESLDASQPWASYNNVYLKRIFQVVEAFKNYDNVLGFFGGNEVVNDMPSGKIDPPYIRAVTRDLKNYIKKHSKREIPVGYSAADVREILVDSWEYLQCSLSGDSDNLSRIDFFGLNSYSWCGSDATPQSAGYVDLLDDFAKTTVPVFFSEYGCNKVQPRTFTEVLALYSATMRKTFSGGLVYEWTQESNDYGLVKVNANASVSLLNDFYNLQKQFNRLDIKGIQATNNTATSLTPPKCDKSLITDSGFSNNFTIPKTPSIGASYIASGVKGAAVGQLGDSPASTNMPVSVYGQNGASLSGLKLKVLPNDESNAPSGTTAGGAGTGTSSGASQSSSNAAVPVTVRSASALAAAGLLGLAML